MKNESGKNQDIPLLGDDGEIRKQSLEDFLQALQEKDISDFTIQEQNLLQASTDYKAALRRVIVESISNILASQAILLGSYYFLLDKFTSDSWQENLPEFIRIIETTSPVIIVMGLLYFINRIAISYVDDTQASRVAKELSGIEYASQAYHVWKASRKKTSDRFFETEFEVIASCDELGIERPSNVRPAANKVWKATKNVRAEKRDQAKRQRELQKKDTQRSKTEEQAEQFEQQIQEAKLRLQGKGKLDTQNHQVPVIPLQELQADKE